MLSSLLTCSTSTLLWCFLRSCFLLLVAGNRHLRLVANFEPAMSSMLAYTTDEHGTKTTPAWVPSSFAAVWVQCHCGAKQWNCQILWTKSISHHLRNPTTIPQYRPNGFPMFQSFIRSGVPCAQTRARRHRPRRQCA